MSEKVKKAIHNKIVKPALDSVKKEANGKVLEVYDQPKNNSEVETEFNSNYADVEVADNETGKRRILKDVPIVHGAMTSNFDGRHIRKGDKVVIDYVGGNPMYPQIIGRSYGVPKKRHGEMEIEKGVYTADAYGYFG